MILGIEYLYYDPPKSKEWKVLKKQWEKYYEGMNPYKASAKIGMRMRKMQKPTRPHYTSLPAPPPNHI